MVKKALLITLIIALLAGIIWFFARPNNSKDAIEAGLPERTISAPDVEVNLIIKRFDCDLLQLQGLKPDQSSEAFQKLGKQYPWFLPFYAEVLAEIIPARDPNFRLAMLDFINNQYIKELYQDVQKAYQDESSFQAPLTDALRFYKHLFPKQPILPVYTMVSGFKYASTLTDSGICLGLDMYLGRNYRFYPKVDFIHEYQRKRLQPEYITPNIVQLLVEDLLGPEPQARVLDGMIYRGKMLYIAKLIQPNTPDSLLTGYTAAQQAWCREFEGEIWAFLVQNKLIFSQELTALNKILNDGPFTNGMPRESPGRIGWWVGWQLVKTYMEQHPETTLEELIGARTADEIMREAGYQPVVRQAE